MLEPKLTGRSVVVDPGQDPPPPWAGCERVRVTAVDPKTESRLSAAWRDREPLVIELVAGLGLDDPRQPPDEVIDEDRPWEWGADLTLVAEAVHHGVWANAVDARGSGASSYRWADDAVALGARAVGGGPVDSAGDVGGDVVLPDGTAAVVDGGPLDAGLPAALDLSVVHRIAVERGSLNPLGGDRLPDFPLAPDQLAAVVGGRAGGRVIAPAGSGKTRVLTERARQLVAGWGLPAGAVAVVAYNVRAARELGSRLADLPGAAGRIRTLNSLCLKLAGSPNTIDEPKVRDILRGLIAVPRKADADPFAAWIEGLSRIRLGLLSPAQVQAELPDLEDLGRVFAGYRAELARLRVVDFDEQVTAAIKRLLTDVPFRRAAQRSARVLLVDEFQDLTPAHVLLLRLLSGPGGAVYGVGDDDQTIYGYAGATPRWLVDFDQWFPGGDHHDLQVNYRCPPAVVTAASNLLTRNRVRVDKVIRPRPDRAADDGELRVLGPSDDPFEASVARVVELVGQGVAPSDVAVLCRVNSLLAPVQVLLRHEGVPVGAAVGERFMRRSTVRAAIAWLTLSVAADGSPAWAVIEEAARRPKRGMSEGLRKLVAKKKSAAGLREVAGWLESKGETKDSGKVLDLAADVERVRHAGRISTAAVLDVLINDVGLVNSAMALDNWSHGSVSSHQDDLAALVALAHLEPDPAGFGAWLSEQLSHPGDPQGVTVASVHAVKGQEWPHVVVHHASAGIMPHRLVDDEEEERRVLHVAVTRSSQTTTVVPGLLPSRFLAELAEPGVPPEPVAKAVVRPLPAVPAISDKLPDPVAAVEGLALRYQGRDYEVAHAEVSAEGVACRVVDAKAVERLALGTKVSVAGVVRSLAPARYDEAFERLRQWRAQAAAGKPAFTVFGDATLRLLATHLPADERALTAIHGIGPAKLDQYGDQLLALLSEYR